MKKKLMALTLAASVMLTGAGYAAWTSNVTVNNSIKTGTFSFTVGTTAPTYVNDGQLLLKSYDVTNNVATFSVENAYPTAQVTINLPIANGSSIPATLSGSDLNVPAGADLSVVKTVTDTTVDPNVALVAGADGNYTIPTDHDINIRYVITAGDNIAQDTTFTLNAAPVFTQKVD